MAKRNYLVEGLSGTGKSAVYQLPPGLSLAQGAGEELVVDASLMCRFSAGALLLRVLLPRSCGGSTRSDRVVRDLGDRGDVQRVVELTVPVWVQPVTHAWSDDASRGAVAL